MSGEMPESQATSSLPKSDLNALCSLCNAEFSITLQRDCEIGHDPHTGDLVCFLCFIHRKITNKYPHSFHEGDPMAAPLFARREARLNPTSPLYPKTSLSSPISTPCEYCLVTLASLNHAPEHAHQGTVYCSTCQQCLCDAHSHLLHKQPLGGMLHHIVPVDRRNQTLLQGGNDGMAVIHKCSLHSYKTYVAVDMTEIRLACIICVAQGSCNHTDDDADDDDDYFIKNDNDDSTKGGYVDFTEAQPYLRRLIIKTLTEPILLKSKKVTDESSRRDELKDVENGNILLAMTREIGRAVDPLTSFVSKLRSVSTVVHNQLSQLHQPEDLNVSMQIQWKELANDVSAFMCSIGDAFHHGIQSLERPLQRINGTVLEAMAIVGLEGINVKDMGDQVLASAPVTPIAVAEMVTVANALKYLRQTLQEGHIGGVSQLNITKLTTVFARIDELTHTLSAILSSCRPLGEVGLVNDMNGEIVLGQLTRLFEAIIGLDTMYFDMFNFPIPRVGLSKLLSWKIELRSKLHKAGLFQEALNALLYDNMKPRKVTFQTLRLIEHLEAAGDPNAPLLRALLRYNGNARDSLTEFRQAQKQGCTHPLLYYFLGDCLLASPNNTFETRQRALEYYEIAIQGMFSLHITDNHIHSLTS